MFWGKCVTAETISENRIRKALCGVFPRGREPFPFAPFSLSKETVIRGGKPDRVRPYRKAVFGYGSRIWFSAHGFLPAFSGDAACAFALRREHRRLHVSLGFGFPPENPAGRPAEVFHGIGDGWVGRGGRVADLDEDQLVVSPPFVFPHLLGPQHAPRQVSHAGRPVGAPLGVFVANPNQADVLPLRELVQLVRHVVAGLHVGGDAGTPTTEFCPSMMTNRTPYWRMRCRSSSSCSSTFDRAPSLRTAGRIVTRFMSAPASLRLPRAVATPSSAVT